MGMPATCLEKLELAPEASMMSLADMEVCGPEPAACAGHSTSHPAPARRNAFACVPSSTFTRPLRLTACSMKWSKSRRGRMAPGARPMPVSRLKGTRKALPLGAVKVTPQLGISPGLVRSSAASAGSTRSRLRTTLPLSASPHTLSRGKAAFSSSSTSAPCLASCSAVAQPPGPPPMMHTSARSCSSMAAQARKAPSENCSRKRTSFSQYSRRSGTR